ncbi:uncharacterized protein LOC133190756 [Saccostrea echinata]|uniref:uncharacterized protein LOC133190756 n=1 Tax=Saccostrea echinata TaxID=191078 RepID=UPI002A812355|nr:uncharacterized protein LOC133190756 [Saccostrea echinata]
MGRFLSKFKSICEFCKTETPTKILLLGLDEAGKSTILYKIKFKNICLTTIPTIGHNEETLKPIKGITFNVVEVGGHVKVRPLWRHYCQNTEGLIYVVDSSDRERIAESQKELFDILDIDEMRGVPVIVMANKQDVPGAMKTTEISNLMSLHKITSREWFIQATCAANGDGIYESMLKMDNMVKENKEVSN